MRRLLLALSVAAAFGAMCTGGTAEEEPEADPVVVPVDGDEEEAWCCEYKDDAGSTQYALVEGPSECNTKYSTQDGRYVSGNQCLPCCCATDKDPDDASKGDNFELTTPKSCNAVGGECAAGDAKECGQTVEEKPKRVRPAQPARPRTVTPPEGRRGN